MTVSAFAQTSKLILHLHLTDSVKQSLDTGRISKIIVSGKCGGKDFNATVKNTAAFTADVAQGACKEHTLFLMNGTYYMVYETAFDVPQEPWVEKTLDIPAVIVAGKMTNNGTPVAGQMNIFPSEHKPGDWGFAVPFDAEGRFEFPLPQQGAWDLDVSDRGRHHLGKIRAAEFNNTENDFDVATSPTR
ncbi:MAG TPA: hypothetical protein VJ853_13655 [Thermoanaerobaculia bacterium]|nr:hypothetical protein [Thermoanaerobaculia bacterium]